jgi:hypothetical protein
MKQTLKAGVLVYTLMMAVIFSFVLQVYFKAIVSTKQEIQDQQAYAQARIMLAHVKHYRDLVDGQVYTYDKGYVTLSEDETTVFVNQTGQFYHFDVLLGLTRISKGETDLIE